MISFMKNLLQQFNTSSYKLLEKAIRSGKSQNRNFEFVENSQIKAFEEQCAEINLKNPDIFATTINELKFWMRYSRAVILRQQAERKQKYRAKMKEAVKSPKSENEIIKSSDDIVQEILGRETETPFVTSFKNELKPDLGRFIQV